MAKFLSLLEKLQNLESGIWKSPFNNWIKIVTSLHSSTNRGKKSHLIAHFLPRGGEHDEDGPTFPKEGTSHVYRRKGERDDFDDTSALCSSSCPHRLRWFSVRCRYDRGLLLVLDGGVCSAPPLPLPPSHRALPSLPPCPVPALPRIREAFNCK